MYRSQIKPLKSLPLRSKPLTSHAVTWSSDAELAVATDETVYVFLPEYPTPGGEDAAAKDLAVGQYSLSINITGMFMPLSSVNAQLCAFAGIRLPPPGEEEQEPVRIVEGRHITGKKGSVSQVIRVEWSPSGLGANLRPVLMVLTTNGELLTFGEYADPHAAGLGVRSAKMWKLLWGLGAGMPVPAEDHEGAYRTMDERITSFSWAGEIAPGRALLAYMTDEDEVCIMSIQYYTKSGAAPEVADDYIWQVRELARFDAKGPHKTIDIMDPDGGVNGTAFSVKWSPWAVTDGVLTASLAIISRNHIGFRKVAIQRDWTQGQEPLIEVAGSDTTGICLNLSTDASLEWEDMLWDRGDSKIARGVICTPFEVAPFQVDVLAPPNPPVADHHTHDCSTTYPQHSSTNPITGLVLRRPDPSNSTAVPLYSAVRASATGTNHDWFETNAPPNQVSLPSWFQKIRQSTQRLVPLEDAPDAPNADTESEDTDDEFQEHNNTGFKIHPYRYRFWGMDASPGGGTTVALVSRHSTQVPSRRGFSRLMFSSRSATDAQSNMQSSIMINHLTTEGKLWEWMYGGGPHVPGASIATVDIYGEKDSVLKEFFAPVRSHQKCVFCDSSLENDGTEARCPEVHTFAVCSSTGLAILAPGISRVCAVCRRRCLKDAELEKIAAAFIDAGTSLPSLGQSCGSCGGKFVG